MAEARYGIEFSEGDRFAGYRIERRLGRGGMGILYLALEPGLERRVALKLIAPEAAADAVFARRFAEESKVAASIEHPNVVPIYAAGEAEGVPFIAMRYVAGADLARKLAREGRLGAEPATELIAQVGNGLDAIHAAGLVHRDVKPANVLLSGEAGSEHAYITDFGVARNVSTESGLTQTGRFVGTLDYVAPEQISGAAIDARADVYALGCLLFKLLSGEVPFPREGDAARLYAHLNDPPPAPSLYAPELPAALDEVVARAMAKRPDDRYPSAGDLGRAAEAALRGQRTTVPERTVATGAAATRTTETLASPDRAKRRNRRLAIGVGIAALAAAAVLAIVLAGGGGGSGPGTAGKAGITTAPFSNPFEKPKPKTLTRGQLIKRADAICESSQDAYTSVFSQEKEERPDVAYAATLAGISQRAVNRFRNLAPPPNLEADFKDYVKAQELVMGYDRQALVAAEAGDAEAYVEAREQRDAGAAERYALAREIGLETCSRNRG